MTHGAVSAAAQSGDESLGLPMAKGGIGAKALALVAASARASHLGVGPRFVDEDQPVRLGPHPGLSFSLPRLARLTHVGPIAFAGLKAFFLKLRPLRISQRDSEAGSAFTPLPAR